MEVEGCRVDRLACRRAGRPPDRDRPACHVHDQSQRRRARPSARAGVLRGRQLDGREVRAVPAGVPCEQRETGDGGVGTDEEVRER